MRSAAGHSSGWSSASCPPTVYRCKGFVHLADDPEHRYVLQVVGRRIDLARDRPWGPDTPQNRVVAIAHRSMLDPRQFSDWFDACADRGDLEPA